jgi:hypothetical protein
LPKSALAVKAAELTSNEVPFSGQRGQAIMRAYPASVHSQLFRISNRELISTLPAQKFRS